MLVLSSPSGAGKTTIAQRLLEADKNVQISVSVTTRPQRENELPGKDYHFVNTKTFQQMQKNGELLEYATVFGHFYGTPREKVEELLAGGIYQQNLKKLISDHPQ